MLPWLHDANFLAVLCFRLRMHVVSSPVATCHLLQIPNLDSAAWASAIGALMSFGYSFICLGMSIYQLATCECFRAACLPACFSVCWHAATS